MSKLYKKDLSGGINQGAAHNLIKDNESPLMVNVTQDELGNVSHRLGSDRLTSLGSGDIKGMGTLSNDDGTFTLVAVYDDDTGTDVYQYDEDEDEWVTMPNISITQTSENSSRTGSAVTDEYDYFAQSFTTSAVAQTLIRAEFYGVITNNLSASVNYAPFTELVSVYIYSDNGGSPNASVFTGTAQVAATYTDPTDSSTVSALTWNAFFPELALSASTTYWLIIKASSKPSGLGVDQEVRWRYDNANPYSGGVAKEVLNVADTTPPNSGWGTIATSDFAFKLYLKNDTLYTGISNANYDFQEHNNKLYFISDADGDFLKAFDGAGYSIVSGNIEGKYLAAANGRLVVAGDGINVYYSNVNGETFDTTNQVIKLDEPGTGVAALGESSPFIGFSEYNMYLFDPNKDTSRKVEGVGCSSHYSIDVKYNNAIWLNRDGIYIYNSQMSRPEKISNPITNDVTYDALFNQIPGDEFGTAHGKFYKDKYFLSVGNLSSTVKGETLNDCWFVFDFRQNIWGARTYTANGIGRGMTLWIDSNGDQYFISGSRDAGAIFKVDIASLYTDDDTSAAAQAVTALYRTKYWDFEDNGAESAKSMQEIYFKLYASAALDVDYAVDGSTTYNDLITTGTTTAGYDWHRESAGSFSSSELREFGLEISGTGNWTLYEYGMKYVPRSGSREQIK